MKNERGAALVTVLILIVVLSAIGVAMVNAELTEITIAYNQGDATAARTAAEAGLARAIYELSNNAAWPGVTTAIGNGQYQVTVTSSGNVRVIQSVGTRGGGRRQLQAAVKALPAFMLYAVLANTTATLGSANSGVTIRNALQSSSAGAVQANNRLGAGTAITVNTAGATLVGSVTANGAISGIACGTWPWTCTPAASVLPVPRLDVDSGAGTSYKSRALTPDPVDGLNLYFRGGDPTSRCLSGGAWNFDLSHTQQCWDKYVNDRGGSIGANIPTPVFYVQFNPGEQTRYAIGTSSAITFRSAATGTGENGNPVTIPKPLGVVNNDVMIAAISFGGDQNNVLVAPAGWTLVRVIDDNANQIHLWIYSKVAFNEGANYAWSDLQQTNMVGGISAYVGVDTTTPIDVDAGQLTPANITQSTPSITTTGPNEMLVTSFTMNTQTAYTPPAGETQRYQLAGQQSTVEGNDELQAAAGATGARTATVTNADVGAAHILALRPQTKTVDCVMPAGYSGLVETLCIRARAATDNTGTVLYPNSALNQVMGTIVAFRRTAVGATTVVGDIALENLSLRTTDYAHVSLGGDPAFFAAGKLLVASSDAAAAQRRVTIRGFVYTLAGLDNPDGSNNLIGAAASGVNVQHGADLVALLFEGMLMSNGSITIQRSAINTGTVSVEYESAVTDVLPTVFLNAAATRTLLVISWSSGD
jgi:hypothetical protein